MNKQIITIEGMQCNHCKTTVEKVLNNLNLEKVEVDLDNKQAIIISDKPVDKELIKKVISDAGFEVITII